MFSINASIGRVPSLHHWGRGILTLPKRANNGPEYMTDDFIFWLNSASMTVLDTPAALSVREFFSVHTADHHSCSKISSIYFTSLVVGTLCKITVSSVRTAAAISLSILFLLGIGVVVPCKGFHHLIMSFGIF